MRSIYYMSIGCFFVFSLNAKKDPSTGIKIVKGKSSLSRENLLAGVKVDEFSAMTREQLQDKIQTYRDLQVRGRQVLEQNAVDGKELTLAERERRERLQNVFENNIMDLEERLSKKQSKWNCCG